MSVTKTKPDAYGILFKAEMVRAILAGRKSQTRRVVKLPPCEYEYQFYGIGSGEFLFGEADYPEEGVFPVRCPYGQDGGKLWVRETWAKYDRMFYAATSDRPVFNGMPMAWTSSMLVPRWASRITLEDIKIRVERVQDIGEEDAIAEGLAVVGHGISGCPLYSVNPDANPKLHYTRQNEGTFDTARQCFLDLFFSINKRAPADSNPWLWVISWEKATIK